MPYIGKDMAAWPPGVYEMDKHSPIKCLWQSFMIVKGHVDDRRVLVTAVEDSGRQKWFMEPIDVDAFNPSTSVYNKVG